jgi:uncharacterized protein (TIGR00159 family)
MNGSLVLNPFLTISLAEVIDIFCVAIMLYVAIVWTQRTRALFVVRGILILGAIFLIARYFDLQMTAWLFQGFFAVFLIMIVVIFQEELRQIFEHIALWSFTGHRRAAALQESYIDILIRTVADFARDHIGALVVITGKDPLERHVSGGIPINGKLSEPLLKSIFDPHSPGHDGAVVLENNTISRFAVHLPLSKDTQQLAHVGTRHSAALGIAELTDAISVVVSEERGEVSIARDGRLIKLRNIQELGAVLKRFLEEKFPAPKKNTLLLQYARENWMLKLIAFSLAIGFWYIYVPGSKLVELTYQVPVVVDNLDPDLKLGEVQPSSVSVKLAGPRRAFYLFSGKKLRVKVDATLAALGRRTFPLTEADIRPPKDIALVEINPPVVRIAVEKNAQAAAPEKNLTQ